MIPVEDFNPNASEVKLYALWSGGKLEAKPRRGGLITKFSNAYAAALWELTPTGWVRIALKAHSAHNDSCTLCYRPGVTLEWQKAILAETAHWHRNSTARVPSDISVDAAEKCAWNFERKSRKLVDPLTLHFLCPECKKITGWY